MKASCVENKYKHLTRYKVLPLETDTAQAHKQFRLLAKNLEIPQRQDYDYCTHVLTRRCYVMYFITRHNIHSHHYKLFCSTSEYY